MKRSEGVVEGLRDWQKSMLKGKRETLACRRRMRQEEKKLNFFCRCIRLSYFQSYEMLVILHVVELYCLRGYHMIMCEFDSQVVVNLLTLQGLQMLVGLWLQLLDSSLFRNSEICLFYLQPSEWNGVGDCLAK